MFPIHQFTVTDGLPEIGSAGWITRPATGALSQAICEASPEFQRTSTTTVCVVPPRYPIPMASLYCWIYFLATLGWTVRALAVGWYNCQGKRWALEYAVPTNALIFGLGLLTVLAWRLMRKKGAPPVPVGELLLFSLVVSLGSVFAQLFILPMLHQACC